MLTITITKKNISIIESKIKYLWLSPNKLRFWHLVISIKISTFSFMATSVYTMIWQCQVSIYCYLWSEVIDEKDYWPFAYRYCMALVSYISKFCTRHRMSELNIFGGTYTYKYLCFKHCITKSVVFTTLQQYLLP